MATPFVKRLASIAQGQHDKFHLQHESDPALSRQIRTYWSELGFDFPGVSTPWSAVFVSWCVKTAGASESEFKFAQAHAVFVHWAIQNAQNQTGLFQAFEITQQTPAIGDIIQNNRNGKSFDFQFAAKQQKYESHSAIVVETGSDAQGRYALTVGGNESDSVGMKIVRLTSKGFIRQRSANPYICIIKTLK